MEPYLLKVSNADDFVRLRLKLDSMGVRRYNKLLWRWINRVGLFDQQVS